MAQTAGVQPMPIAGRVAIERERCLGMTAAEREWRKQWLKDQILAPNEPVHVEEYWRERTNPIRRFYRWPLDTLYRVLSPVLGETRAADYRYIIGKTGLIADWTKKGGWRVIKSKPMVLPGQDGFPFQSQMKESDYAARGFKNSVFFK
ncbi:unnamed protein product [Leptidea sinapis]|uniref:Uncharacterized protein n=1 Tax=Leptidea sinapis TaxID=189913 RepID=A0A5E4QA91_9NEOP|nr:unnamed protein product [Leptidea sinapis]